MFVQNHPLLRETNKMNLSINRAAYTELSSKWKCRTTTAAFHRIYFVTEGAANIVCNGVPYKLLPGNIYIIPAGTPFSYDCDHRLCKLYYQFNLYSSANEDLTIAPVGCIVFENRAAQVAEMIELFKKNDFQSALAQRIQIEQLILEAMRQTDTLLNIPHYSPAIKKALRLITDYPSMALTISVLADAVYLSPAIFQTRFKKEVGMAPIRYLRQRVIAALEHDLRTTDLSLSELAEKYGFCDQFHLSRVFTAKRRIPPSKYRKTNT